MLIKSTIAKRPYKPKTRKQKALIQQASDMGLASIKAALDSVLRVDDDINTIRSSGVTSTQIAKQLHCSKWAVWAWRTGKRSPRSPIVAIALVTWASKVRELYPVKEVASAKISIPQRRRNHKG